METPYKRFTSPEMWAGLKQRTLSALALAVVVLTAELVGGLIFTALVLLVALQMIREWDNLTREENMRWRAGGFFYVAIPALALIWLRGVQFEGHPNAGMGLVLYLLFAVWATDIGAYFAGRAIGGPKLAPAISPSKTWAGLAGGALAAGLISVVGLVFSPYPATLFSGFIIGILLALLAQGGDLFESWLKRRAGVKDSGTLMPGHGGVLDRIDGLIFTTPVFALLVAASGKVL